MINQNHLFHFFVTKASNNIIIKTINFKFENVSSTKLQNNNNNNNNNNNKKNSPRDQEILGGIILIGLQSF